jgi:hypothetical protein
MNTTTAMETYFIFNVETKTWTETDEATYNSHTGRKLKG